ncbi:MAG TPA: hypothetical protein VIU61_29040 [Kofleriaceae bacterium]
MPQDNVPQKTRLVWFFTFAVLATLAIGLGLVRRDLHDAQRRADTFARIVNNVCFALELETHSAATEYERRNVVPAPGSALSPRQVEEIHASLEQSSLGGSGSGARAQATRSMRQRFNLCVNARHLTEERKDAMMNAFELLTIRFMQATDPADASRLAWEIANEVEKLRSLPKL